MPFSSESQRRYLWMKHPEIAEQFAAATPKGKKLPEHVEKVKQAEPPPPKGVSVQEWDKILSKGPGKLKKADFPNAAGPEDWDAVGVSPFKKDEPCTSKDKSDAKKEKISQGDDLFGGDGTKLMPYLRSIHKMGHVVSIQKLAQGDFEYADLGPNAGERQQTAPSVWKMPGKLMKRSAGLDQEKNLDDQERGTDPPAPMPQPIDERLKTLAKERGPIKKFSQVSYRALLDELQKIGMAQGICNPV